MLRYLSLLERLPTSISVKLHHLSAKKNSCQIKRTFNKYTLNSLYPFTISLNLTLSAWGMSIFQILWKFCLMMAQSERYRYSSTIQFHQFLDKIHILCKSYSQSTVYNKTETRVTIANSPGHCTKGQLIMIFTIIGLHRACTSKKLMTFLLNYWMSKTKTYYYMVIINPKYGYYSKNVLKPKITSR